ncbi:uncharacterized protein LOC122064841 [Macadamia integrifolia]|uniref:uncharacterized protein LOC122064841 n=1 Tax=Macadamia integrifolia TaxID=60698 RepID=UPI001C4F72C1|nr:uncharacterized protein LOC122064841 [Macadamia integrifolia]
MAHVEDKKNDACIYVVSVLFCISVLAGGVCLTLYITLQETTSTIWKIAVPTAQAVVDATSGTATGTSDDSPADSPGGRRVRFGDATVVGRQDSHSEDMDGSVETESDISHDEQGYHGSDTLASSSRRESEQPLTFSISS